MGDLPILFSAPMIRALLREIEQPGTGKTQTRRANHLTKLRRFGQITEFGPSDTVGYDWHFRDRGMRWHDLRHADLLKALPYQGGDRLWVRETWAVSTVYDRTKPRDINPGGKPNWCGIRYAANHERLGIKDRPSIHMPRWVSRITLMVTGVKVERLNDICEEDAWAEGCIKGLPDDVGGYFPAEEPDPSGIGSRGWDRASDWYADLWETINGPETWDANPWVAAYTFKPALANIDAAQAQLGVAA